MDRPDKTRRSLLQGAGALTLSTLLPANPAAAARGKAAAIPSLAGKAYSRNDPAYELQRRSMVWWLNAPARYPQMIVRAASTDDVRTAVDYAHRHGLQVVGRGGGHNCSGLPLRDGTMVIDQSAMREMQFDSTTNVVSVTPAVWNRHLHAQLQQHGRAFPYCHCGTVPLSGYLLGGGQGWNAETWDKMACFAVVGAEIVTADGALRSVSAREHEDLYWAVRGAGTGFFGIVTRYHLKTWPTPGSKLYNDYYFDPEQAPVVAQEVAELLRKAPKNVEAHMRLRYEQGRLVCRLSVFAFGDDEEQVKERLALFAGNRLLRAAVLKKENVTASFYGTLTYGKGAIEPSPARYASDNLWTEQAAEALQAALPHLKSTPSASNRMLCTFRGDISLPEDAAFSMIGRSYLGLYAIWDDPRADAENKKWLQALARALEPMAKGYHINEIDVEHAPEKAQRSFSAASWRRLGELRHKYDPSGVFCGYLGA